MGILFWVIAILVLTIIVVGLIDTSKKVWDWLVFNVKLSILVMTSTKNKE